LCFFKKPSYISIAFCNQSWIWALMKSASITWIAQKYIILDLSNFNPYRFLPIILTKKLKKVSWKRASKTLLFSISQPRSEFYQDYQQLFTESPDYFCHFLKADCSLISEILPQRTHIKLETLLIQNGFDCNKEFIKSQLEKVCEQQLEKVIYWSFSALLKLP